MKKSGLGCIVTFAVIMILGVTMHLTCPTKSDHMAALEEVVGQALEERLEQKQDGLAARLMKFLGVMTLSKASNLALSQFLEIDNYYVVTVGRIKIGSNEQVVSLGAFGHVFTPSKERLLKEMEKHGL